MNNKLLILSLGIFSTLACGSAVLAAPICIVSKYGFRPQDPTFDVPPSTNPLIFSSDLSNPTKSIELLNGLASVRARVCTFKYSNSASIFLRSGNSSKVVLIPPYSCMDTYVPAVTILNQCDASAGCHPLDLEQWCVNNKNEPLWRRWKGKFSVRGYYTRDYISSGATKLLNGAGIYSITSSSQELTMIVTSTRKERFEVCSKIGTVIAVSDQALANTATGKFKSTSKCSAVEGHTIWIEKPTDPSLLPIQGSYRPIP